ncbi:DsrE family protein [candidate division CSSED10-310 bacterium]|uniref:DsrE family protein n=1 Tax=candidate division CSSED10-310 bacterium TaxID=2855610 RepID=A0ABV6Z5E4_UNCC1
MSNKVALFAFNGELMCFGHVLLNALDMKEKGFDVKVIIEGSATKLLDELATPEKPFHKLFTKVKKAGLLDCVCQACASKMNSVQSAQLQQLRLCNEMSGHPSMARYLAEGYTILIF